MIKYKKIRPCVSVGWRTYARLGIFCYVINLAGMTLFSSTHIITLYFSQYFSVRDKVFSALSELSMGKSLQISNYLQFTFPQFYTVISCVDPTRYEYFLWWFFFYVLQLLKDITSYELRNLELYCFFQVAQLNKNLV